MEDVQRAKALLEQIKKERGSGVVFKRIVTWTLLGFFVLFFGSIYMRVQNFDGEKFVVELQHHAAATLWPVAGRELEQVTREAVPAITNALADEAEKLIPRLSEKLMSESAVFQANVANHLKTSLEAHFLAQISQHQDQLDKRSDKFKANADIYEDLVRRLEVSARLWAQDQLDTVFYDHIIVLQSINKSVATLQEKAREEVQAGTRSTPDDVLLLLVDILNARLDGEG